LDSATLVVTALISCFIDSFNAQPKAPALGILAGAFGWALNEDTPTASVIRKRTKWRCPILLAAVFPGAERNADSHLHFRKNA